MCAGRPLRPDLDCVARCITPPVQCLQDHPDGRGPGTKLVDLCPRATGTLPLGLLCLGRDGFGGSLRLCRLRFDDHRFVTSLCSPNQMTATFCAGPWASGSPNWLDVVSQCARFGTAAAKWLFHNRSSTPLPPVLGKLRGRFWGTPPVPPAGASPAPLSHFILHN
jgi:hypothetical protein